MCLYNVLFPDTDVLVQQPLQFTNGLRQVHPLHPQLLLQLLQPQLLQLLQFILSPLYRFIINILYFNYTKKTIGIKIFLLLYLNYL